MGRRWIMGMDDNGEIMGWEDDNEENRDNEEGLMVMGINGEEIKMGKEIMEKRGIMGEDGTEDLFSENGAELCMLRVSKPSGSPTPSVPPAGGGIPLGSQSQLTLTLSG